MNDLNQKTILVTGGTGFIGKPLCQALADHGARVIVLTRRTARRSDHPNIGYIASLADMGVDAPDIVINLAGAPIARRWTRAVRQDIRSSRLGVTTALFDYMRGAQHKPAVFISASAIGYYGTSDTQCFSEESAPSTSGGAFAHDLCAAWETCARAAEQEGIRTIVLRIGAVLGLGGGMLKKLMLPFRMGLGGPIGHGRQWLSWIDRDDLIALILHIIATPSLSGPVNATAPNPVSNDIFSRTLADVLHRPCFMRTPAFALRLVFGDMADEIMLEGQQVVPDKALKTGFVFRYPDILSSLRNVLGKQA